MKVMRTLENKSPVIFSLLGITGFITSVVMAAKAAPVAEKVLNERPNDADSFLEKTKAVIPIYAPTAGMVLISTGCILASNRIYHHRYSSILALYALGERSMKKWQDVIFDEVGEKSFEKVRERVVAPEEAMPAIVVDDPTVLCYDTYSGRYFKTDSVETVRRYINDLNDVLFQEDFVGINDFYFMVGLPKTEFGDDVGWNVADGSIQVRFDSFLVNDRPCVVISFGLGPKAY